MNVIAGVSSFAIGGVTLHKLFRLPVQKSGSSLFENMSDEQLKSDRMKLKNCRLLIIDEVSMV